jgi:SNF2 family DNA or RNA helicase
VNYTSSVRVLHADFSANRFGQKKNVFIHKLIVPETVEARIQAVSRLLVSDLFVLDISLPFQLQDKKRQLANSALTGEKLNKKNQKLGMEELLRLFSHDF